jgi:hypothetical protein
MHFRITGCFNLRKTFSYLLISTLNRKLNPYLDFIPLKQLLFRQTSRHVQAKSLLFFLSLLPVGGFIPSMASTLHYDVNEYKNKSAALWSENPPNTVFCTCGRLLNTKVTIQEHCSREIPYILTWYSASFQKSHSEHIFNAHFTETANLV